MAVPHWEMDRDGGVELGGGGDAEKRDEGFAWGAEKWEWDVSG